MSQIFRNEKMLQKWVVLLLWLAIPAMALGQKKGSTPAPHAAPSHASAPHASAPSHSAPSHSTAQTHSAPTHSAPSHSTAQTHSTPSHSAPTAFRPNPFSSNSFGGTDALDALAWCGRWSHNRWSARRRVVAVAGGPAGGRRGNTRRAGTVGHGNGGGRSRQLPFAGWNQERQSEGWRIARDVRRNGSIRSVNRGGMHIEHGVHGGRVGRAVIAATGSGYSLGDVAVMCSTPTWCEADGPFTRAPMCTAG